MKFLSFLLWWGFFEIKFPQKYAYLNEYSVGKNPQKCLEIVLGNFSFFARKLTYCFRYNSNVLIFIFTWILRILEIPLKLKKDINKVCIFTIFYSLETFMEEASMTDSSVTWLRKLSSKLILDFRRLRSSLLVKMSSYSGSTSNCLKSGKYN